MREIKTTTKVYEFEELKDDIKEKVLDNHRYINVDFDEWNDWLIEDFIREIKEKTNLDLEQKDIIWEAGSRNAKFGVYSTSIINQLISRFEMKYLQQIDISTTDKLGSFLSHMGGGICSRGETEKDLAEVYFEEGKENKAVTTEINKIINIVIELAGKYHIQNEEVYNENISDENVKKTLLNNEYEFTEDGRIF